MPECKVRFAPSPTGYLHIGSARTALFNWLFARHSGGTFFLRIEDTDRERSKDEFLNEILSSLKWLGMDWDGEPVFQNQRTNFYRQAAEKLIQDGKAYYEEKAIRFRTPKEGKVSFDDLLHGRIEFDLQQHPSLAEDLVIFKSDGSPTYNFAVVCDDSEMGITHVIRGDDHISNTPKQVALYDAMGFRRPIFCHIPLILGPDRSRMSKRHGATSIREYLQAGHLPEAMVNYLALLGWSPGNNQELMGRKELVEKFNLKRVLKTGAVFDKEKLEWFNKQYLKKLPVAELADLLLPYLRAKYGETLTAERSWLERLTKLYQERIATLSEFPEMSSFFFQDGVEISPEGLAELKKDARLGGIFRDYAVFLGPIESFETKILEEKTKVFMADHGLSAKEFIHPCRLALTGRSVSPGFYDTVVLLGKEKSVKRLLAAADLLVK